MAWGLGGKGGGGVPCLLSTIKIFQTNHHSSSPLLVDEMETQTKSLKGSPSDQPA